MAMSPVRARALLAGHAHRRFQGRVRELQEEKRCLQAQIAELRRHGSPGQQQQGVRRFGDDVDVDVDVVGDSEEGSVGEMVGGGGGQMLNPIFATPAPVASAPLGGLRERVSPASSTSRPRSADSTAASRLTRELHELVAERDSLAARLEAAEEKSELLGENDHWLVSALDRMTAEKAAAEREVCDVRREAVMLRQRVEFLGGDAGGAVLLSRWRLLLAALALALLAGFVGYRVGQEGLDGAPTPLVDYFGAVPAPTPALKLDPVQTVRTQRTLLHILRRTWPFDTLLALMGEGA